MKYRWTFRCYPTPEQEAHLARTFGSVRYVWNWALRLRTDGFRNGERIGYPETDRRLTLLKREPETAWLNDVSSVVLQQSLRDLQTAFSNFFDKRSGYPAFKRKDGHQSANYSERGFFFDPATRTLKLAKVGTVKVKWSRGKIPQPSSVRLIRKPSGRYFVSLVVDVESVALPHTGESIGIDFGISRLATLSNGERIANPKRGSHYARLMKRAQQSLARKHKGSKRRMLAKRRVARIHEKIANCRTDVQNKLALSMVRRFDVIYIEDLNVRGMVKNHSLARALSDAALGGCIRKLEEKATMHGKKVIRIDRFFPSSKTCSDCGCVQSRLPLSVRLWTCPHCGADHDRDVNAAKNIKAAGLAVSAHGGGVRAVRAKARTATGQRSANHQSVKHLA